MYTDRTHLKQENYLFEYIVPCKYNGIKIINKKIKMVYNTEDELERSLDYYKQLFKTNTYYKTGG